MNCLVVDPDQKIASQFVKLIRELDRSHQISLHTGIDEVIANPPFPSVDLLIFNIDVLDSPDLAGFESLLTKLDSLKPKHFRTRFVLIKKEDAPPALTELLHPQLDDLLFLPLDRPLTQQKLEIVLGLPDRVEPSILSLSKLPLNVEFSQLIPVVKINEIGFVVRTQKEGQLGSIQRHLIKADGTADVIDVMAKTVATTEDPDHKGAYLTTSNYYGLQPEQLSLIRKYTMEEGKPFKILDIDDPKAFQFSPYNLFLSEDQKRFRGVVILDTDVTRGNQLSDMVLAGISNCHVSTESLYKDFHEKYIDGSDVLDQDIPPATEKDLYQDRVSFTIDLESRELLHCFNKPTESDLLLGFPALQFFNPIKPRVWEKLFELPKTKAALDESLKKIFKQFSFSELMRLNSADGDGRLAKVKFSLPHGLDVVPITAQIDIEIPQEEDLPHPGTNLSKRKVSKVLQIDTIIIDDAMIPADVESWYMELEAQLAKSRFHQNHPRPNLLILNSTDRPLEDFSKIPARNIYSSQPPRHLLMADLVRITKSGFSPYQDSNIRWKDLEAGHCFAGKPGRLPEISEFGSRLPLPFKVREGSFLFLQGSLFEEAPDKSVCIRFYHSEPDSKQQNRFICSFSFFGLPHSFVKTARRWIPENFAKVAAGSKNR